MKKIFGILMTTLVIYGCSTTQHDKLVEDEKSAGNYEGNISLVNGKYPIDVLPNNNLQLLIEELEKVELDEKKTVAEIPHFIKSFLDSLTGNFSIANPNEDWQVGCSPPIEIDYSTQKKSIDPKTGDTTFTVSIKNKNVPTRQLIYFGLGKGIALMTYYTGGFGKSEHILIFKFDNTNIIDFWCDNVLCSLTNKAEALKHLKENKDWGLNINQVQSSNN